MADLYVLAVDLPAHPNPKIEAYKYKAGDVLAVLPDGAGPGRAVEKCGLYKVVRVPGDIQEWKYLTTDRPFDRDVDAPRRVKTLDIAAVYSEFEGKKVQHPRMGEMVPLDGATVKAIEITTVPASGALVIG